MRNGPSLQNLSSDLTRSGTRGPGRAACTHCGATLAPSQKQFCCAGCEQVFGLLCASGLAKYYELRGERGIAVADTHPDRDLKWLVALEDAIEKADGATRVSLDVQGLHCSACVWLIEELFRRGRRGLAVAVNPALGKLELVVEPGFALRSFVIEVEAFGYLLGPSRKEERPRSSGLLWRIGVCAALAMNSMLFAIAIYCGLSEGPIFKLFHALTFALGCASVLVGGSVFIRSAWNSVARRVLHLDVPIALGIVLAFAGSTYSFLFGQSTSSYFDTIDVFIALMLTGRWLQERVIERNRHLLLACDGADGLLTRRLTVERADIVPCKTVRSGDLLLIAPGDLVPVDARLDDDRATCSLDWISGESSSRAFLRGAIVPAGAFNAGRSAITVCAATDFSASPIVDLLRTRRPTAGDAARTTPWWQRFTRVYVVAVMAAAFGGFAGWLFFTGDLVRALEVTTAVLVVTCPCAFGIATPLAYELVHAGLRRAGLFVRSSGFLDRASSVRRVVFDKTGTLTTGNLSVGNAEVLATLTHEERQILFNLVARSTHPKSTALKNALDGGAPPRFDSRFRVVEAPGRGLTTSWKGREHSVCARNDETIYAVDGRVRAAFRFVEASRIDAGDEVRRLAVSGYEVWILSGDAQPRVRALAARLGIPEDRAIGESTPEAKARFLEVHDHADTLMIGDGINDSLAVARAFCSGTPAIDRPFMPARSDFFFTTPGLRPIRLALLASRELSRVTRRNLAFAVAYNAISISLAYAGLMSPLLCAVVMPVSSLSIVAATLASLSERSPLWKS